MCLYMIYAWMDWDCKGVCRVCLTSGWMRELRVGCMLYCGVWCR